MNIQGQIKEYITSQPEPGNSTLTQKKYQTKEIRRDGERLIQHINIAGC